MGWTASALCWGTRNERNQLVRLRYAHAHLPPSEQCRTALSDTPCVALAHPIAHAMLASAVAPSIRCANRAAAGPIAETQLSSLRITHTSIAAPPSGPSNVCHGLSIASECTEPEHIVAVLDIILVPATRLRTTNVGVCVGKCTHMCYTGMRF